MLNTHSFSRNALAVAGKLSLVILFALCTPIAFGQVNIMTFNIRYATPADGQNAWEHRKESVVSLIDRYHPDFLGIQEATPRQLVFLHENLKDYAFIGHGRDGKDTDSEAVPLFYRKDKFLLLRSEVFWLSPTPDNPSLGWDAHYPRIAVYGAFKDRQSGDTLHVINTHFDHEGKEARERSAEQLLAYIEGLLSKTARVVAMGDLNCEPDSPPIVRLKTLLADTLDDAAAIPETGTFNGFDRHRTSYPRIDYIFTRGMKNRSSFIITDKRANGLFPSDHYPVFAELVADPPVKKK